MNNDLISRSSLIEIGAARKIIEVVGNWNELPGIAKAACTRLGIAHKKLILDAPAVDAVEVVRCKDCVFYDFGECANYKMDMTDGAHFYPYPDDFCSYAERRADDGI